MLFYAYKLNKQNDNIQLTYSFPNFESVHCYMSSFNCCFLTCTGFRRQVRRSGIPISLSFPWFVVIHTVKGFSIVNEEDVVFLEFSCFLGSSGCWQFGSSSSAFSKSNLYICKFLVHILLQTSLKDFEHCLASLWNNRNYRNLNILWHCLLWDWNENWPFLVL